MFTIWDLGCTIWDVRLVAFQMIVAEVIYDLGFTIYDGLLSIDC